MAKIFLLLMPVIITHQIIRVKASPQLEVAAKLKEKINTGKLLVESLTELLEELKTRLEEKKNVDKSKLDEFIKIKDQFKELEVDAGDLPAALIEKFKEKTLEAFTLILSSYNLHKNPYLQKLTSMENIQKKVEKELSKRFPKEL